jgi:hypothetical protein
MSHAQMDVSNHQTNAPNRDQLNTSSVKTKIIADGALASGRIARVPAIRRDASLAGMGIRIRRPTIVPMKINQFHASVAMRHQIVIKFHFFSFEIILNFLQKLRLMQRHSTLPANAYGWRISDQYSRA